MRVFKRLNLGIQFGFFIACVVLSAGACLFFIANDLRIAQAKKTASASADFAESIGVWAANTNGLWVRTDPGTTFSTGAFLDRDVARSTVPDSSDTSSPAELANKYGETVYHRKNPALIQREVSDQLHRSGVDVKFRMLSDNPLNPGNLAGRFEVLALEKIRADLARLEDKSAAKTLEYSEATSTGLKYARAVVADKACLKCHDTAEKAPDAVKKNHPGSSGFGYKEGAVVGVISVYVPMWRGSSDFFEQFSSVSLLAFGVFLLFVLLSFVFLRRGLVKPVSQLTDYAASLGPHEQANPPNFDQDEENSANQLHRLSASIKAMQQNLRR